MVKVMYLPINGQVKQTGMYDGFKKAGVDLHVFDYYHDFLKSKNKDRIKENFIKMVRGLKPDLLHMQLQFTDIINENDLIAARAESPGTIITDWTGDIRKDVPKTFSDHSKGTDISFISSVGQLPLYRKECKGEVRYWQIGYNPKLYFPKGKNSFKYDLAFVASKYPDTEFPDARLRTDIVSHLRSVLGGRFGLFGGRWGNGVKTVKQSGVNEIYNSSFAVLSVSNFNDVEMYFSDRLLMCMASGRPCICYRWSGWEQYFTDMENIVIVNSKEEIVHKFNWLKAHPDIANEIGRKGAEIVQREHTYFCRALELLKIVGLR
jgi:spore maturation protein CgeB